MLKFNVPGKDARIAAIYCIVCTHPLALDTYGNPLFYIGRSINVGQRYYQHVSELRRGEHSNEGLQLVYNLYGADSLEMHILEIVEDLDVLNAREAHYIDELSPQLNVDHVKLSPRDITEIREAYSNGKSYKDLAKKYSISIHYLKQVLNGYRWK